MQDFRKIRAWQANRELTVMIYRATASFPREERFGMVSQMRGAAVSIGANMAEGAAAVLGRTRTDSFRSLSRQRSSCCITLSQLWI
jgi:four helix bundle protein